MRRKYFVGCICIMAMLFTLAACTGGDDDNTNPGTKPTENNDPEITTDVDLEDVYAAYISVLEENQEDIEAYTWQHEVSSEHIEMNRQVALADINRDGVPELFFFKATPVENSNTNPYEALLYMYTYENGEAVEISYSFNSYGEEGYLDDHNVAAGVSYVIYTGTDGNLYIYYVTGDAHMYYYVAQYQMDGTELTRTQVIKNEYGPSDNDTNEMIDDYQIDGKDCDSEEGISAVKEAFGKLDTVALFSGYTDSSIWNKFNPDSVESLSCEDMIKKLQKGID